MERICEPELMEDVQQAEAYAAADFSSGDRAVLGRIDDLLGSLGTGDGETLSFVDLGCGPGNITFLLAERWPKASVLGLDGSAAMLAIAERRRRADPTAWRHLRFRQQRLPSRQLVGTAASWSATACCTTCMIRACSGGACGSSQERAPTFM